MSDTLSNTEKLFDYSSENGGFNKPAQQVNFKNPLNVTLQGAPTAANWKDGLAQIQQQNLQKKPIHKTNTAGVSMLAQNWKPGIQISNTSDVQKYLNEKGITDQYGKALVEDDAYGDRTYNAIQNALKSDKIDEVDKNRLRAFQSDFEKYRIKPRLVVRPEDPALSSSPDSSSTSKDPQTLVSRSLTPNKFSHANASDKYYRFLLQFERDRGATRNVRSDGSFSYTKDGKIYYGNGRMYDTRTKKMSNYQLRDDIMNADIKGIRNDYNTKWYYGAAGDKFNLYFADNSDYTLIPISDGTRAYKNKRGDVFYGNGRVKLNNGTMTNYNYSKKGNGIWISQK